jgi:hypothetical protein
MKSIPLLFKPDMSAAVRRSENPKTQTRRKEFKGSAGDSIWGRETFYAWGEWLAHEPEGGGKKKWTFHDLSAEGGPSWYLYDSDCPDYCLKRTENYVSYYRRPSLFMPKAACRMNLLIKSIRHQALQDISEADAIAEGIEPMDGRWKNYQGYRSFADPRDSFRSLWDSINSERGMGWDTNPDVVAVEFERI